MTKRTKPKAPPTVVPTINSAAPVSLIEGVKAETKAKVASEGKQANTSAKNPPSKHRGRPKKVVVKEIEEAPITPLKITYKYDPKWDREPKPSLYDRFVGWLFKVTYLFRGY